MPHGHFGVPDLIVTVALCLFLGINGVLGFFIQVKQPTTINLSLLGWVAAWFAGLWFGPVLAPHLPIGAPGSGLNAIAAFVARRENASPSADLH